MKRSRHGAAIGALAAGLPLAIGLVLVAQAFPGVSRPRPEVTGASADATSPQGVSRPFATPGAGAPGLARPGCSASASPLVVVDAAATTTIVNTGSNLATLGAFELGWSGEARLAKITLGDAGSTTTVYEGNAISPTYVAIGQGVPMAAGSSLEVTLTFSDATQTGTVGPLIAHFVEGCALAISAEAPAQCRLSVGSLEFPPTRPSAVEFPVLNGSSDAVQMIGTTVTWPQAVNGSLLELMIDGVSIATFGNGDLRSPARLDFTKLVPAPVLLPGGASRQIRLRFEGSASNDLSAYAVTVDDGRGCRAADTSRFATGDCGVQMLDLVPAGRVTRLVVVNLEPVTRTLTSLDVFWPTSTTGPLTEVRSSAGVALWSGSVSSAPARLALDPAPTVPPLGRMTLLLSFQRQGGAAGNDSTVLGGGPYTVVAHFLGGCAAVYSTRSGRPGSCSITAGEVAVQQLTASVALANQGSSAKLDVLVATWPAANGALREVRLDDQRLWSGVASGPTFTVTMAADAWVKQGDEAALSLVFDSEAASGPYSLSLAFVDDSGQPCDELLITARPASPECSLQLADLRIADLRWIEATLKTEATDPVLLRYLRLAWPTDGINSLREVALTQPGGETVVLWGPGAQPRPPAVIVPASATRVEPGVSTLRFQFTGIFSDVDLKQFALDVAADCCNATLSGDGGRSMPETATFSGWIAALPQGNGLFGDWEISVIEGNDSVQHTVWVDDTTEFDPPNINPVHGDSVTVTTVTDVSGRARALSVRFSRPAFYDVQGVIEDIDPTSPPRWITVKGRLVYVGDAVIEGRLALGAVARILGTANPDGSILALRVTILDASGGEYVETRGLIQSARPDPDDTALQVWSVDGRRVRIDPARVEGLETGQLPALGTRVVIKGRLQDGVVRVFTELDSARILPAISTTTLTGTIVDMPESDRVGIWSIRTTQGTVTIRVGSRAIVDARLGPARIGAHVRVLAEQGGGSSLTAIRVMTDRGP